MKRLVFVYGTLKSGYSNNRLLSSSKLLGKAFTKTAFLLTDTGFPYLVPSRYLTSDEQENTKPVVGEVYEVEDPRVMESLDGLEGVGYGHYQHEDIDVDLEEGGSYTVTAYVPCSDETKHCRICPTIMKDDKEYYQWG